MLYRLKVDDVDYGLVNQDQYQNIALLNQGKNLVLTEETLESPSIHQHNEVDHRTSDTTIESSYTVIDLLQAELAKLREVNLKLQEENLKLKNRDEHNTELG